MKQEIEPAALAPWEHSNPDDPDDPDFGNYYDPYNPFSL